MGGVGSGLWYRWNSKPTVENYRSLDVRVWHSRRLLRPGVWFTTSWSNHHGEQVASVNVRVQDAGVTLRYGYWEGEAPWQNIEQWVSLTWTPCRYGGQRPWFICPGVVNGRVCGRRVAILYGAGPYFLCRHCYNLAYESQREDYATRLISNAQKIRLRLGGSASLMEPFPPKPKRMYWRTYDQLWRQAREAEMFSMLAAMAQLEGLRTRSRISTL